jgi:hypothetical protein
MPSRVENRMARACPVNIGTCAEDYYALAAEIVGEAKRIGRGGTESGKLWFYNFMTTRPAMVIP